MKPAKDTPEWDLWIAAIEVAIFPPLNPTTFSTQVATKRIQELRAALDELGIDWREAKTKDDETRAAGRARQRGLLG